MLATCFEKSLISPFFSQKDNGRPCDCEKAAKVAFVVITLLCALAASLAVLALTPAGSNLFWVGFGEGVFALTALTALVIFLCSKKPLKEYFLSGGLLQQRAHHHLLSPLIDVCLYANNQSKYAGVPLSSRIDYLREDLNSSPYYAFLREGDTELSKVLYSALNLLCQLDSTTNAYTLRHEFYKKINQAFFYYEKADKNSPECVLLQQLGFALFTKVHLQSFADDMVFTVIQKGNQDIPRFLSEDDSLAASLERDKRAIEAVDKKYRGGYVFDLFNRIKGHLNIHFNPLEENNFASVLWNSAYKVGKHAFTTTCLRFGSPTKESCDDPEVIPQLYLFLDHCKAQGLRVTVYEHQNNRKKGRLEGNEKNRFNAMLKDLAEDERYQDTLFVFAFPMDGDFFHQRADEEERWNEASFFIEEFERRVLAEEPADNCFYIPFQRLDAHLPEAKQEIREIIKSVHLRYFGGRDTLTSSERRIFQVLAMIRLKEYFNIGLEADFNCSKCKDTMDRSMIVNICSYYDQQVRMGKENDPEVMRNVRVLVHFAPLLIKGSTFHSARFSLLIEVIDFLARLSPDEKEQIQKEPLIVNGEEYFIEKTLIELVPNQTLAKTPSEAKSLEEYAKRLEEDRGSEHRLIIEDYLSRYFEENKHANLDYQISRDSIALKYLLNGRPLPLEQDDLEKKLKEIIEEPRQMERVLKIASKTSDPFILSKKFQGFLEKSVVEEVIEACRQCREAAVRALCLKPFVYCVTQSTFEDLTSLLMARYRHDAFEIVVKQRKQQHRSGSTVDFTQKGIHFTQEYEIISRGELLASIRGEMQLDYAGRLTMTWSF